MADLISREYVLAEYDRQHKGPPGGARKIMEDAPAVDAIPVEWLQGLMIEYANINTPEHAVYAYCLNNVIEGWQKDQERKRNG